MLNSIAYRHLQLSSFHPKSSNMSALPKRILKVSSLPPIKDLHPADSLFLASLLPLPTYVLLIVLKPMSSHRRPNGSWPTPHPVSPPRRKTTTSGTLTSASQVPGNRHTRVSLPHPSRNGRQLGHSYTCLALAERFVKCELKWGLGGIFKLELFLPEEYPMNPPKVRFLTKI